MTDLTLSDRLRGIKLADMSIEVGNPIAEKPPSTLVRVPKAELEAAFALCGLINSGIIRQTQIIMSGEPILECDDKKVLKYFEDFLENIGNRGNDIHWDELLNRIFLAQFIYGEAWVEKTWNTKHNRIIDLDIINAKTMDYAKKGESLALDEYGVPLGYVQEISAYSRERLTPPEGVTISPGTQWIPKDRIAHFTLHNFGSGYRPIGLIEPAYADTKCFLNEKNAYNIKLLTTLLPKYLAKIGNDKHMPTPEIAKDIVDKMKKSAFDTEIAIPYFHDISILQPQHPDALLNFLQFFSDQIVISLRMPKPIVTGLGEETNRATLNVQTYIMLLSTKDTIKRTVRTVERQIFKPMADAEGFKTYPKITWNFSAVEDSIKNSIGMISKKGDDNDSPKDDNA